MKKLLNLILKSGSSRVEACRVIAFSSLVFCCAVSTAFSGEKIRLKSGTIQSDGISISKLLYQTQSELWIVQFKEALSHSTEERLKQQGFEVLNYIPDDAYLVRASATRVSEFANLNSDVQAVVPFNSRWKWEGNLPTGWVMIRTFSDSDTLKVVQLLKTLKGIQLVDFSGRAMTVSIDSQATHQLSRIAEHSGVEWIQEAPFIETMDFKIAKSDLPKSFDIDSDSNYDDFTGFESGTQIMGFPEAWKRGMTGKNQFVAVADTGLDVGSMDSLHADFKKSIHSAHGIGLFVRSWGDPQGHGTHVMGSVTGSGSVSKDQLRGGAFDAKLVAVGMWSEKLNNLSLQSNFEKLAGIPYQDGARIHSNSWGRMASPGLYDSLAASADDFMFNNPEMLLIFAAGNSGVDADKDGRIDLNSIATPASAKNVLTVGASENTVFKGGIQRPVGQLNGGNEKWGVEPIRSDLLSNNERGIAAFSSRGPTQDGRLKPEIVAPGTNILSVKSQHPKAGDLWGRYSSDYVWAGGTSMATPLTAGAAAVARQMLVEKLGVSQPSAASVKALLIHTATDLAPGQFGLGAKQELSPRPDMNQGYGRVNVDEMTQSRSINYVQDHKLGLATGEEFSVPVTIRLNPRSKAAAKMRATLVYTDAPGAPSAAVTLVNNLDLEIRRDGRVISSKSDRINNHEMLEVGGLGSGTYQVAVRGVSVPKGKNGKQPFSLIISY